MADDYDGVIKFKSEVDAKPAKKGLDDIGKSASASAKGVDKAYTGAFSNIKKSAQGLGQAINAALPAVTLVAGVAMAFKALADSIKIAGEQNKLLENMTITISQFTGSAESARDVIDQLADSSASSVYALDDLTKSAETMAKFGVATEDLTDNVKMLGDVALGDAGKLDQLSLAFSKVQASGKLTSRELMMMINNGFNPLEEMSKKTGKSVGILKQEMEAGLITSKDLTDALKSATSEGGKFEGVTDRMALSMDGLNSAIGDNFTQAMANIFKPLESFERAFKSALADVLAEFNKFTEKFAKFGEELKKSTNLWANTAKIIEGLKITLQIFAETLAFYVNYLKNLVGGIIASFKALLDIFPKLNLTKASNEFGFLTNAMAALNVLIKVVLDAFRLFGDIIILDVELIKSMIKVVTNLNKVFGVITATMAQFFSDPFDIKAAKAVMKKGFDEIGEVLYDSFENTLNQMQKVQEQAIKLTPKYVKEQFDLYAEQIDAAGKKAAAKAELANADIVKSATPNFDDMDLGLMKNAYVQKLAELAKIALGEGEKVSAAFSEGNLKAAKSGVEELEFLNDASQEILKNMADSITQLKLQLQNATDQATYDVVKQELDAAQNDYNEAKAFADMTKALYEQQNKALEDFLAERKKLNAALADTTQTALQGALDLTSDFLNREMDAFNKHNNELLKAIEDRHKQEVELQKQKEEALEGQYNDGLKSSYEYERAKAEMAKEAEELAKKQEEERLAFEEQMAKERDAIARKQFNANKANQLSNNAIKTAQTIMGIWASSHQLGIAGPIWAGVQTGIVSAISATQAAMIASQQYVGAYEKGGIIPRDGIALVGERGAELVQLPRGARVYDANKTANMLNSNNSSTTSVNNINMNINAPQGMNVKQLANQINRQLGSILSQNG